MAPLFEPPPADKKYKLCVEFPGPKDEKAYKEFLEALRQLAKKYGGTITDVSTEPK